MSVEARRLAGSAALVAALAPALLVAQDADRGRLLYENGCVECHGRSVFSRQQRLARDVEGIREQVRRWRDNSGLPWTESDIADVTSYLNRVVYRYGAAPG